MNELLLLRYTKMIMKYGIPKLMAKEIASLSIQTSKGKNVEKYISYAIDLQYGLGFSKQNKINC